MNFKAILAAAALCFAFLADAEPLTSIKGRLRLPDDKPLNSTLITLNDGQLSTYTQPDGSFIFHTVSPGVHVLNAHSHVHHFSQIKIQLLTDAMDAPKCIEYVYPGAPKQAVPHPLILTAHAKYEYFEKRQGFSVFSILKNPMLLMMMVSGGMMFFMPKMMDNLNDDDKERMKRQMEMQQDPSKMISQLWGDISGSGEDENTVADHRKASSKAGAKTTRRTKRD